MTEYTSYWLATAPKPLADHADPESSYDVVIIGAGLPGLTTARLLSKQGMKVAVIERGVVGEGASGRNGGHLNNGLAHGYADAVRHLGREGARRLYHAYDSGIDLIEETVSAEAIDCKFRRAGKLKLASRPGHVEALRDNFELIKCEADPEARFLAKDELSSEILTNTAYAGLLYPKSAMMHMGRYLHGLAGAVQKYGGSIVEHCAVNKLYKNTNSWVVDTVRGKVQAEHLVIAAGATGAGLMHALSRQVLPVGSYIVATRPLTDGEIAATLPGDRNYVTSLNIGNYFRLAPDKRLIFGGRARFSSRTDAGAAAKSVPILRKTIARMFPALEGIEIDYAFGGLVDLTRDRLPRAGRTADGALFAVGYSGHGAQMSTYMGTQLARDITGEPGADYIVDGLQAQHFWPWAKLSLPAIGWYFRMRDLLS